MMGQAPKAPHPWRHVPDRTALRTVKDREKREKHEVDYR
jgi:hypothetical protein